MYSIYHDYSQKRESALAKFRQHFYPAWMFKRTADYFKKTTIARRQLVVNRGILIMGLVQIEWLLVHQNKTKVLFIRYRRKT